MNKGKRIRNFFEIEADAMHRKYLVIEKLLPSEKNEGAAHSGEEGRYIESLIRDFLNRHLPNDLRAMSGFILRPSTKTGQDDLNRVNNEKDQHSRQLDIIVYDSARFPIYEHFEEFCIVPPEGVIGIISVKKTLRKRDVVKELESLIEASNLCRVEGKRRPYIGLFAFQAEKGLDADKCFDRIRAAIQNIEYDNMINEITVMDKFLIFKFRKGDSPKGTAKYVKINCKGKRHIAIQRILQSILGIFYTNSLNGKIKRPGFVSFEKGTFGDAEELGCIEYI